MTKAELKQNHPDLYSEVLSEGVVNEQERVASWMVFNEADPTAVAAGVASGKDIKQSETLAFMVAIANKGRVADLVTDSAQPINTPESQTEVVNENSETAKAMDFKIKAN